MDTLKLNVKAVLSFTILLLSSSALSGSKLYFVHSDHLGRPQKLTDAEQNVVWEVESQSPDVEMIVNEE